MLNPQQVLDQYYLEVRCKLLDIAAILDRYDRASKTSTWNDQPDPQIQRCRQALDVLHRPQDQPNRAEQIALIFSDPTD